MLFDNSYYNIAFKFLYGEYGYFSIIDKLLHYYLTPYKEIHNYYDNLRLVMPYIISLMVLVFLVELIAEDYYRFIANIWNLYLYNPDILTDSETGKIFVRYKTNKITTIYSLKYLLLWIYTVILLPILIIYSVIKLIYRNYWIIVFFIILSIFNIFLTTLNNQNI